MRGVILGCLCIAGLSMPAFAQVRLQLKAEIPFAFHVGDAPLPTGEYRIIRLNDAGTVIGLYSMEVTGFNRQHKPPGASTLVINDSITPSREPFTSKLVFNKYGQDRYFLAEVQWDNGVVKLNKSRRERELITSTVIASRTPERITIVATLLR